MAPLHWFTPKILKTIKVIILFFCGTLLLFFLIGKLPENPLSTAFEDAVYNLQETYQNWFQNQTTTNPLFLLPLAFAGGLIASISPCILSLLPINLTYIGTRKITSRWDAFRKASAFVLGVVTMLSIFGLFSSFAGAIMIHYRGYVQAIVGAIIIMMGLNLTGIFPLPIPQTQVNFPVAGAYGVGLTFALLSSPCTSPILFAVIAAGAATGSTYLSILTMIAYSLGYTAVIFFASLFTGLLKQSRRLLQHSQTIISVAGVALILTGLYYLFEGIQWIILVTFN